MAIKDVIFRLKAKDTNVKSTMKGVNKQAKSTTSSFQSLGKSLAVIYGATKLFSFLDKSVQAFNVQQKAVAQLNQVLESTGGKANLTSSELQGLASSLQKVTTFGDEAIIGMESLLLTFTNIRGDVFEEATGLILDMSVAMGQDLKSSAIQVGKALNDPILGVSALGRVGIQFTKQQKELIKTLAESGEVAEAQAIIMKELNVQFGGSAQAQAQTYAGKVTQLSNSFGDLMELLGQGVVPALELLVDAGLGWVGVMNDMIGKQEDFTVGLSDQKKFYKEIKEASDEFLKSELNSLQALIEITDTKIMSGELSESELKQQRQLFETYLAQFRVIDDILSKSEDLSRLEDPPRTLVLSEKEIEAIKKRSEEEAELYWKNYVSIFKFLRDEGARGLQGKTRTQEVEAFKKTRQELQETDTEFANPEVTAGEWTEETIKFQQAFESGFMKTINNIGDSFVSMFAEVFDFGDSLLGKFASALVSGVLASVTGGIGGAILSVFDLGKTTSAGAGSLTKQMVLNIDGRTMEGYLTETMPQVNKRIARSSATGF